jgi:glycosyltransferase involved in cell wall biosynthesis
MFKNRKAKNTNKDFALKINILTKHNGKGLQQDATCLESILEDNGFVVTQTDLLPEMRNKSRQHHGNFFKREKIALFLRLVLSRMFALICIKDCGFAFRKYEYDINIFLEVIEPRWFHKAKRNLFIPNQEWITNRSMLFLGSLDLILCKTIHAFEIFKSLNLPVEYLGFTSNDHFRETIHKNYNKCLHLAGGSELKGTKVLLEVWSRHPDWPTLKVVKHKGNFANLEASKNIEFVVDRLSDDEILGIQNSAGIHICPSEVEGFGHVLVEGMSCASIVVTTDAPPMNELIDSRYGVLVSYSHHKKIRLGTKYYVDLIDLENRLQKLFNLDLEKRRKMGEMARESYIGRGLIFRKRLFDILIRYSSQPS